MTSLLLWSPVLLVGGLIVYGLGKWYGEKEGFRKGFVYGWQALHRNQAGYAPDDVVRHVVRRCANEWEGQLWEWLRDSGVIEVIVKHHGERDRYGRLKEKYEVRRKGQ